MPKKFAKKIPGFTLIELLIVITIIAILLSFMNVSFIKSQQKARDSRRKADLAQIQGALEQFYADNFAYPYETWDSGSDYDKFGCETVPSNPHPLEPPVEPGQPFTCNGKTYLNNLPQDPLGYPYYYEVNENSGDNPVDPHWCTDIIVFDIPSNRNVQTGKNCQNFTLWASLENKNDPNIMVSYTSTDPSCVHCANWVGTDPVCKIGWDSDAWLRHDTAGLSVQYNYCVHSFSGKQ